MAGLFGVLQRNYFSLSVTTASAQKAGLTLVMMAITGFNSH
jgi:hypothetical protein